MTKELKMLTCYSRGATFLLINSDAYYLKKPLMLTINGVENQRVTTNIFSVTSLKPDTLYKVVIGSCKLVFTTLVEEVAIKVEDFGAVADGVTDNSRALQAAISSICEGGTLIFSKGCYLTGPLFLKSYTNIYLEDGCELKALSSRHDYPVLPKYLGSQLISSWEGEPNEAYASLLTAINVKDVLIYGRGSINGAADESDWWQNATVKRGAWRPRTIFIAQSSNITVAMVTLKNSPSWSLHCLLSHHLNFYHITIQSPCDSPNTDGFDPEMSSYINFIGCDISVGDDCVAIKAGKGEWARHQASPAYNIIINNCLMRSGHAAIALGSEMSGGMRNIEVSQCRFEGTDRGIRIKTRRGRGGYINRLDVRDIEMDHVATPLVINNYYFCCDPDGKSDYVASKEAMAINDGTPMIKNISLKNIRATNAHVAAGLVYGLAEMPIKNLSITNMSVAFALEAQEGFAAMMRDLPKQSKENFSFINIDGLVLNNVKAEGFDAIEVKNE